MDRRSFLLSVAAAGLWGCARPVDPRVLRLGFFPNVTHGVALTGVESGRFAEALRAQHVQLEPVVFNAGSAAIGALLGGAVDVVYVGPSPALAGFVRSRGKALHVICGAASGGAGMVVRADIAVSTAQDLHGKKLATPQLGNTQDIALRYYLQQHSLRTTDDGGDVAVLPLSNSDVFGQFRRKRLDGAWVAEPWVSRLILEANGRLFLDERDIWPNRRFASTVVVVRTEYLTKARENVQRFLAAHRREIEWINQHEEPAKILVNRRIQKIVRRAIPRPVLDMAWGRVEFLADPLEQTLRLQAQRSQRLGFLPQADLSKLVL